MFGRWLIGVLVVLALVPGSAGAVTLVTEDGSVAQPYQAWADFSDVPTVDRRIVVYGDLDYCGVGALACVLGNGVAIHSPLADCGGSPDLRACRFNLMHELGHVFDYGMPGWKRQRFLRTLGLAIDWTDGPAERWADVYAMCAMHTRTPIEDRWLPSISARSFRRVCHLIRIPQ